MKEFKEITILKQHIYLMGKVIYTGLQTFFFDV